jgi:hypothetical protein
MPDTPRPPAPSPLGLTVSIASPVVAALVTGAISWGSLAGKVDRNHETIAELRLDVAHHHAEPGHAVGIVRLDALERRMGEVERLAAEVREMRADVAQTRANVAALCRAEAKANCGP